jgi:hypothetical protein
MLHEKRRLAFTIGSGLILAIIVGCASHTSSDVNASLRPPQSSARTDIAADTCGTIAYDRNAGTEPALSPADPGLGVDRELTGPTQQRNTPVSDPSRSSPKPDISGPGRRGRANTGQTDPLPPPAAGFPERLPPSP